MQRLFLCFACLSALLRLEAVSPGHTHPPAMLGVALDEILAEEAARFGLPGEYGAWVLKVAEGSPASAAGIQEDDVILAFNGQRVESARALQRMVGESPAGRNAEIRLMRGSRAVLVHVTLGAAGEVAAVEETKVAAPSLAAPTPAPTPRAPRSFGVGVEPLAPQAAEFLGLEAGTGLIVRMIKPGSAAEQAGLRNRDVLLTIGGAPIREPGDVATFINEMPGDETLLGILRDGEKTELPLRF